MLACDKLNAWALTEFNNCADGGVVRALDFCPEGPGFDPLEAPRLSRAGEIHAHLRGSFFRQLRRLKLNSRKTY